MLPELTRRSFLAFLAALPIVGRLVPAPTTFGEVIGITEPIDPWKATLLPKDWYTSEIYAEFGEAFGAAMIATGQRQNAATFGALVITPAASPESPPPSLTAISPVPSPAGGPARTSRG